MSATDFNHKIEVSTTEKEKAICIKCASSFFKNKTEKLKVLCPTCTRRKKLYKQARKYFKLGHRIIRFKINEQGKKIPDLNGEKWSQWQNRRQTQAEFEALHIENCDYFGVLSGVELTINGETVYFVVIDRDTKDPEISHEIKEKTLQAIKLLPVTQQETTMNNGDHLNLYSRILPKSKKLNQIGMELLSKGNLAVVYPSKGYSRVNDNEPTIVTNAESLFYNVLEKVGLHPKKSLSKQQQVVYPIKIGNIRSCFYKLMKKTHLKHDEKVAFILELAFAGKTKQEIIGIFVENQSWERSPEHIFSLEKTRCQIEGILAKIQEGTYKYRLKRTTLQEKGICYSDCELINCVDCRRKQEKPKFSVNIGNYSLTKVGKKLVLKDENEKVCSITPYFKLLTEKFKQKITALTHITDIKVIEEKIAELELKVMEEEEKEEETTQEQTREAVIEDIDRRIEVFCDSSNPNLPVFIWTSLKWEEKLLGEIYKTHYRIYGKEEPESSAKSVYEYYQGKGQFTIVLPKPPHLIAFQNGFFNLKTRKLEPLTSKYFTVNVSPFNFIENPQLPKFQQFQKDVHHIEDIDFTNEVFAYCLYTNYARPLILFLIGNGQNGKSVELAVIMEVLGTDNVSTISLQDLVYSPYGVAEAYHKLAIISDDITNSKIKRTGKIKALASGSKITARRIFGSPFDFENYAKLLTACNEPPEIDDDTDSLWIRVKFVDYPNKFVENPKPNTNEKQAREKYEFIEELLEEKEQIASFLVLKLAELYQKNFKFSFNKSTNEVREYYRRKSQPIICWLEECFKYTGKAEDNELKDEIYPKFKTWCEKCNIKTIPKGTEFFRTLINEGLSTTQPRAFGRKRVYEGYKVVTTKEEKKKKQEKLNTTSTVTASQQKNSIASGKHTLHSIVSSQEVNKKATCDLVTNQEKIVYYEHIPDPKGKCSECKGENSLLPTIRYWKKEDAFFTSVCSTCFGIIEKELIDEGYIISPFTQEEREKLESGFWKKGANIGEICCNCKKDPATFHLILPYPKERKIPYCEKCKIEREKREKKIRLSRKEGS